MCLRSNDYKDKEKLRETRNKQRKRYFKQTQGNEPRRWEPEEIRLMLETKMTDRELAKTLNRSIQSIQMKRHRLKLEQY